MRLKNFSQNAVQIIANEPEILKDLDHKYIVKLYETREVNGVLFQFMESLPGGDLRQYLSNRIKASRPFMEDEVRSIIKQILKAVKYLHNDKGLIHRDIKPENILIQDTSGSLKRICVKLADFGLATYKVKYGFGGGITGAAGTRLYMAPEMFFDDEYHKKIDTWAIGCIIYN
jgi:serine/threonine protein kinase